MAQASSRRERASASEGCLQAAGLVPELAPHPKPTEKEIRIGLSVNLCRCTGYDGIVCVARQAAGGDVLPLGEAPIHADSTAPHHAG